MKEIPLTQGYTAIVDDEDYNELAQYKWQVMKHRSGPLARRSEWDNGKMKMTLMARQIMNAPAGMVVDHVDHDRLNNQRANLRVCTPAQNRHNSRKPKGSYSSRWKGVCWSKRKKKWEASIRVGPKLFWLGYFAEEDDAGRAYNRAARERFGEYACLNDLSG